MNVFLLDDIPYKNFVWVLCRRTRIPQATSVQESDEQSETQREIIGIVKAGESIALPYGWRHAGNVVKFHV